MTPCRSKPIPCPLHDECYRGDCTIRVCAEAKAQEVERTLRERREREQSEAFWRRFRRLHGVRHIPGLKL